MSSFQMELSLPKKIKEILKKKYIFVKYIFLMSYRKTKVYNSAWLM